jgi:hypothetical protein
MQFLSFQSCQYRVYDKHEYAILLPKGLLNSWLEAIQTYPNLTKCHAVISERQFIGEGRARFARLRVVYGTPAACLALDVSLVPQLGHLELDLEWIQPGGGVMQYK